MLTAARVSSLFLNNPQGCFFKPGEINVPLGLEDRQDFRNTLLMHIPFFMYTDFSVPAQHFGLDGKETDIFLASP